MLHTCTQHAANTSTYTATPHELFHHSCQTSGRHRRAPAASAASAGAAAAAAAVQTAAVAEPTPGFAPQTAAVKLDPELKAKHKRPDGWTAPGPQPWAATAAAAAAAGSSMDPDLCPGPNETLSYLTGDWRLFQLRDGHRWSMDDMLTAYVALQTVQQQQQPDSQQTQGNHLAAVAAVAAAEQVSGRAGRIRHVLDLGCGIGSVLLMVAWGLRRMAMEQQQQQQQQQLNHHHQQQQQQQSNQQQQQCFSISSLGVEAQAVSYQLALRSVKYNLGGQQQQVQVLHQDLRQPLPPSVPQAFQLITGTPPYVPLGAGGQSKKPQKGPCCVEIRGGIEDYCQAAAAVLDRGGCFVACMGLQGQPFKGRRAQLAAAAAGLVITRQVTVVTREGKPPLFGVYVMQHAGDVLRQLLLQDDREQGSAAAPAAAVADGTSSGNSRSGSSSSESSLAVQVAAGQLLGSEETFIVRHADGRHTAAWHAAREAMGLPPLRE